MNDIELGVGIAYMGIGGGEGRWSRRGNLQDFTKQFFPRQVQLTFEGVDGRGGYNTSRGRFQYLTTRVVKHDFLRRRRLGLHQER